MNTAQKIIVLIGILSSVVFCCFVMGDELLSDGFLIVTIVLAILVTSISGFFIFNDDIDVQSKYLARYVTFILALALGTGIAIFLRPLPEHFFPFVRWEIKVFILYIPAFFLYKPIYKRIHPSIYKMIKPN